MPRREAQREPLERWGAGADWSITRCHCPVCLHTFNAAGHPGHDDPPKPGDYTVCIECAVVLEFTPSMTVRQPTVAEVVAARMADPDLDRNLQRIIDAVRAIPPDLQRRDRGKLT